jgi:hypothetical protein
VAGVEALHPRNEQQALRVTEQVVKVENSGCLPGLLYSDRRLPADATGGALQSGDDLLVAEGVPLHLPKELGGIPCLS